VNTAFAYQIQCHGHIREVSRLLSWIYHEKDHFFISVDQHFPGDLADLDWALSLPNVFAVPRLPITWGGGNLVASMMSAMTHALRRDDWDYFINLSAHDLPLANRERLCEVLREHDRNGHRNFVSDFGCVDFDSWSPAAGVPRAQRNIDAPGNSVITLLGGVGDLISADSDSHQAFLPVTMPKLRPAFHVTEALDRRALACRTHHEFETNFLQEFYRVHPYHFGRQWIVAGRALCSYLVGSQESMNILNVLTTSFIPDESFVQTVAAGAPADLIGGTLPNNLRYHYGSPENISDANFNAVLDSGAIFARKLDYANSSKIVLWAEAQLADRR